MTNNEIRIPGYEKFLEAGKVMLENEIKKYESQGFKIRNENNENNDKIKMSRAVLFLTDSSVKNAEVLVETVTFSPNPEYNFDFYIEAREYASDERVNPLSYKTDYESFITKLDSKEITPAEKADVESSDLYQKIFGGSAPGAN